jgi:hypothetical protein
MVEVRNNATFVSGWLWGLLKERHGEKSDSRLFQGRMDRKLWQMAHKNAMAPGRVGEGDVSRERLASL